MVSRPRSGPTTTREAPRRSHVLGGFPTAGLQAQFMQTRMCALRAAAWEKRSFLGCLLSLISARPGARVRAEVG